VHLAQFNLNYGLIKDEYHMNIKNLLREYGYQNT
jgi:hypothetical protein